MKKSLLALAALTAFAGAASAQSSVTLFGVVDLNMRSVDNSGGETKLLGSDGLASNRERQEILPNYGKAIDKTNDQMIRMQRDYAHARSPM